MMEVLNDIGAVEYLGINTLTIGVYDTWVVRGTLGGAAQLALGLLGFMALLLWLERRPKRAGRTARQKRPPAQPAGLSNQQNEATRHEPVLRPARLTGPSPAGLTARRARGGQQLATWCARRGLGTLSRWPFAPLF